ncbi:MAG: hypothetical protein ACXVFN_19855 [Solirubrobacteraceae bacterium]
MERPATIYASTLTRRGLARRRARLRHGPRPIWAGNALVVVLAAVLVERVLT